MENLAGQSEVVRFARAMAAPRSVHISPVTIATRFGPYPAGPAAPGDLPPAVDVRQASLLGAAWTVGSIAALAASGAASVTYYETTGWRGVLELDEGSPMPGRFPSAPGQVFPLYHVLADVAEWRMGTLRAAGSTHPLQAVALALDLEGLDRVLVANVRPEAQRVRVAGLRGDTAHVRVLDEASVLTALDDPASFRATEGGPVALDHHGLWLELGPYAVARIVTRVAARGT